MRAHGELANLKMKKRSLHTVHARPELVEGLLFPDALKNGRKSLQTAQSPKRKTRAGRDRRGHFGFRSPEDQAKLTVVLRRRIVMPTRPRPPIIMAQVEGSGTAVCTGAASM